MPSSKPIDLRLLPEETDLLINLCKKQQTFLQQLIDLLFGIELEHVTHAPTENEESIDTAIRELRKNLIAVENVEKRLDRQIKAHLVITNSHLTIVK